MKWRFNPPSFPHFGEAFEVLVRCVKTTLRVVVGEGPYYEDVLQTALTHVEAIVNSRPIINVSDDPTDYEALSSNHLLFGQANPRTPPDVGILTANDIDLRKR